MTLDRTQHLVEEGYEHVAIRRVALPHAVWKVDLDVEEDRKLRLAEETVLKLIQAGVANPSEIESLMGLDEGVIVRDTIVALLKCGHLSHLDRLRITASGLRALSEATTRGVVSKKDVDVRYDPYRDELVWSLTDGQEIKAEYIKTSDAHVLPPALELSATQLEVRHREVQDLLDRFGFPWDQRQPPGKRGKTEIPVRDIVRLKAKQSYLAYRDAELEVWHQAAEDEWQWRLLHHGGEDRKISDRLKQMESDGTEIIPVEEADTAPLSIQGNQVHQVIEAVECDTRPHVLETDAHRDALKDAIVDAKRELIIISPWLRTAAVDQELLSWLTSALQKNRRLRIWIGYGIEHDDTQKKGDWHLQNQRTALKTLNRLGSQQGGRLKTIELGNTHEKIVICDKQYAIITSFNWLSFNPKPGKAVRREMGTRITEAAAVQTLRRQLMGVMGVKT